MHGRVRSSYVAWGGTDEARYGTDFDKWLIEHDMEVVRSVWGEAADIARSYDQGFDPTPVSIAEEFDGYAICPPAIQALSSSVPTTTKGTRHG